MHTLILKVSLKFENLTDFTLLGGLDLHTTISIVPGAFRVSNSTSVWGQLENGSVCSNSEVLKYLFFFIFRREARASEHFTGGNFVKQVRFTISFLPSDGAI